MILFILKCKKIYDKYVADEMTVYAAQASFFILLSAFPFIMLLLTGIQLVPSVTQTDLTNALLVLLPSRFSSLVINIINDLYTKSPGTILSISAITALWSASKGMLSIERGLNRVLNCREKRNYIVSRLICSGYTILFMIACITSLLLLVLGSTIQNLIYRYIPFLREMSDYILNLRTLIALALFIFLFSCIYTVLPHKRQSLKSQLPGAIFSTVCWIGFSFAFSLYFHFFKNFSYMYGSLTAIVLFMLWLYVCICILFLGAELNQYLEHHTLFRKDFDRNN